LLASFPTEPYLTVWVAVLVCTAAVVFPGFIVRVFSGLHSLLDRLGSFTRASIAALVVLVAAVRLALVSFLPVPNPGIHDEFSYLLMADTFTRGRLANPTPAMWRSFETFHVLWHPTYASKYPPAQGLVLALGQLLGHPWIGVLLTTAAMCAAIFWALLPFLPRRWALLAGLLAFVRLGIASYWMNSYWGGSAAALGGALVLGAAGRLLRQPSARSGALLGTGLAILANSRPYEGLAFALPVALLVPVWCFRTSKVSSRRQRLFALLPTAAIGFATLLWMGYYNLRVTGDPLLMPHVLAGRQYDRSALFIWQRARPPIEFGNPQLDEFYNQWERENYNRTWGDLVRVSREKWWRSRVVFLWPGLLLALPGLVFVWRGRRFRLPLLTFAATLLAFLLSAWWNPHYLAPLTAPLFGAIAQGFRRMRTIQVFRRPLGAALALASLGLLAGDVASSVGSGISDPLGWGGWGLSARRDLEGQLAQAGGLHLVLVRYGPDHSVHEEWVFNGAEIDSQKVIWARELDAEQNARLLTYYRDRQIWLVEPDVNDSELQPYPAGPHRKP
jgi:hypothetical protein